MSKGFEALFASVLLLVICSGCRMSWHTASRSDNDRVQITALDETDDELQPRILMLDGNIGYDTVKASYSMTVKSQMRVNGFMNLEDDPLKESEALELNYVQLAQDSTVLSIHKMGNPLVQQMEYHDGDIIGRKTIRLSEAPFYLRIQLNPSADRILFRNGRVAILMLDVNN